VIIADDAVLVRQGVARLLEDKGFEVIDQLDDPGEPLARVELHCPDVVIVDIRMPRRRPPRASKQPSRSSSTTPVSECWSSPSTSSPGTPREREVLSLMPQGRSNAALAQQLFPQPEDRGVLRRQHLHQARPAP
jgi:DNA-binding NarL/FixJ family response regulator